MRIIIISENFIWKRFGRRSNWSQRVGCFLVFNKFPLPYILKGVKWQYFGQKWEEGERQAIRDRYIIRDRYTRRWKLFCLKRRNVDAFRHGVHRAWFHLYSTSCLFGLIPHFQILQSIIFITLIIMYTCTIGNSKRVLKMQVFNIQVKVDTHSGTG